MLSIVSKSLLTINKHEYGRVMLKLLINRKPLWYKILLKKFFEFLEFKQQMLLLGIIAIIFCTLEQL